MDFVFALCDRIASQYEVKIRKAYNVYVIYVDDKPIFYVRDEIIFIKTKENLDEVIACDEVGYPFSKTIPFYIVPEVGDEMLNKIIASLCKVVKENYSKNSISRYKG